MKIRFIKALLLMAKLLLVRPDDQSLLPQARLRRPQNARTPGK
jgi:hypothetical protein